MAELLLATNNKGKLEEFSILFAGLPYKLVNPFQLGIKLDVEESGNTYSVNARLKARAFSHASGLLTLADDSGLEVEALNNEPGVMSSRYAGANATDSQRVAYLIARLKGISLEQRVARFHCVIAIVQPNGDTRLCSGSCRGVIALEPRGNNGFGYDPIFYFPKLCKTMAELPSETKNRISHRARAAMRARQMLLNLL